MTFQRANENLVGWHTPFDDFAFHNGSQHFKKFGEELVTNVSVNIRAFAVAGGMEVKSQIPIFQPPLNQRDFPLAAVKKDEGVDIPSKKIRSLNVVCLIEGIQHQCRIEWTAALGCSGQFYFTRENRSLAAFAKNPQVGTFVVSRAVLLNLGMCKWPVRP